MGRQPLCAVSTRFPCSGACSHTARSFKTKSSRGSPHPWQGGRGPHHRFWRVPQLPGPWDSPAGPSPSDLPTAWNRPPDLQPPLVLPGPCSPHPCPRGHHCVPATLTCERPALPSASGETQRPCLHRQQGGGGLLLCTCTKAPTCKPGPSVTPRECSSGHLTRPEAMVCPHGVRGQRRDFHFLPRLQKTCFVGDYHFTCVL